MIYCPDMAAKKLSDVAQLAKTVERGFAALAEDIGKLDAKIDHVEQKLTARIDHVEQKLTAQIEKLDTKLGKFEDSEIDKRKQLEVRVTAIERHLGLDKKIAA
jgi:septal ring factor EnvC (AmiA/AmiB activator)